MPLNRRRFLTSSASLGLAGLLSRPSLASGGRRRFVFISNSGGWDATHVLNDAFERSGVDMEPEAERSWAGALPYVSHPSRPSVDRFFQRWGDRCVTLHGLEIPSLFHEVCSALLLTGGRGGVEADWATRVAAAAPDFPLPHLVLSGPSYPGAHAGLVARPGLKGQLQGLATGDASTWAAEPMPFLAEGSWPAIDAHLAAEAARADPRSAHHAEQLEAWLGALGRAQQVEALSDEVRLQPGGSLLATMDNAASALASGLSRCVSLSHGQGLRWDTHANGWVFQPGLWEGLFEGLEHLVNQLAAAPGEGGGSLADETVVVVLSEMGRAPSLNSSAGKHHWPWTSALLFGAGVAGGQVLGGYEADMTGSLLDLGSGEAHPSGVALTPAVLGATLLALADLDPGALGAPLAAALL